MRRLITTVKTYLFRQPVYYRYYKKLAIRKNVVLLESTHGKTFQGHLFYLLRELVSTRPELNLYVVGQTACEIKMFLTLNGFDNVMVVKHLSKRYLRLLASAEFLLNDTTFYPFFIKKPGQRYVNFWHGTPLKTLGHDMENVTDAANVQRNFYMTDQIIVGNQFLADTIARSHGLNGIFQGEMVIAPSPRNSILMDDGRREVMREKLGITEKKVSFYMPTWRGTVGKISDESARLLADLRVLSMGLSDAEVLYVKLHPFVGVVDLNEFENIKMMPAELELYEFLTVVDVLVTDYSSIMYDFVLTNRPVILYMYDQDDYFATRGVYDDIDRYPFRQALDVEDLLLAIKEAPDKTDYSAMVAEFCPVDCVAGAKIIADYIFGSTVDDKVSVTKLANDKETVLVLGGEFWDNGVTIALLNTFDNIDLLKRNYVVLVGQRQIKKEHEFRVRGLPEPVTFYAYPENITAGPVDRFLYLAYLRFEWFDGRMIRRRVGKLLQDEFKRFTGDLKIAHFIHYTGFGARFSELVNHLPPAINTVHYAHTDMIAEYAAKRNFNQKITFSAYQHVDKVAVVHENLKAGLIKAVPNIADKLYVMNNFLGEERVRTLAQADLVATLADVVMEHGDQAVMLAALNDQTTKTFINIGRFDYQKGHDQLIAAFAVVYQQKPEARLIIVAPHGPLRDETLAMVANSSAATGIFVLGRMSNPYALLANCDCFVLSSRYEGLGLVVYEALAVGTAVVTVDLEETIGYLQNNEAIIVDQSIAGLTDGMLTYLTGVQLNEFDFSIPLEWSKAEFERLFS